MFNTHLALAGERSASVTDLVRNSITANLTEVFMLTQEYLKQCLNYDADTGVFTWKDRPRIHFPTLRGYAAFKSQFANNIAGAIHYGGETNYRSIRILDKAYLSHRLAWLYTHGEFPIEIDHIDGNGENNKIENLRNVSHSVNCQNMPTQRNNTSGVVGVNWDKAREKWSAEITASKNKIRLGRHAHLFEAACARKSAEIKHGFHINHGRTT